MAIIFALITYFSWGVGDVFGALASKKMNPFSVFIWFEIFNIIFMLPISFFYIDQLKLISLPILLLLLLLSAFSNVALILFFASLGKSNATLIGTLVSSFAAVSTLISIIVFRERITALQASSIMLIFLGIVVLTLNFNELKNGKLLRDKYVVFAFGAMILWGIYFGFMRIPIEAIGWFWSAYIPALSFPMMIIPFWLMKVKIQRPTTNKALIPLILNSVLLSTGGMMSNLAISKGLTSIVISIAGAYPTLFAVLSYLVFREPLVKREIYGIIITLVGIVLLSSTNIH